MRVADIHPGPGDSAPAGLTFMSGRIYFSADDGEHGRELWRTDGTAGGTHMADDLEPGPAGSSPESLSAMEGLLFFSADTTGRGREPWRSDGSVAPQDPPPSRPPPSRPARAFQKTAPGSLQV